MTHPFENITTLLVIVIMAIIPLMIMYKNKLQKKRRHQERLNSILNAHQGRISEYDSFRDYAIGLDREKGLLAYTNYSALDRLEYGIRLSDYKECNSRNVHRDFHQHKSHTRVIDRLELVLTPRSKVDSVIVLEFYNAQNSPQLINELQLMERWQEKITEHLKSQHSHS